MTVRNADILNIPGAQAFLAGADTLRGRCFLSEKIFFHWGHASVNEEQRIVIFGYQRKAGQPHMPLFFKKPEISFTEFIEPHPFHKKIPPFSDQAD